MHPDKLHEEDTSIESAVGALLTDPVSGRILSTLEA